MTEGFPSYPTLRGGPSIITDDISIYTATIIDTETILRKDIKFSRMDTNTYEKTEIFRKDFTYYNVGGERMMVAGNPLMALGGMETVYYLEYYWDYYVRKFYLMKVDFIAEEITPVYMYEFGSSEGPFTNQLSNFMIVVKDEGSGDQYLVWDINKEENFVGQYSAHSVVETEYYTYADVDPCTGVPHLHNYYTLYQDQFTRLVKGIHKIDYYVMKLFADESVDFFTVWENSYNINGYDAIETVYMAPSPIIYTGDDGTTYLYVVYGYNGSSYPLLSNGYDPVSPYYTICTSVNEYLICPEIYSIMYYACWIAEVYCKHKRAYNEMYVFWGNLFFTVAKVDIAGRTAEFKEIFNNRIIRDTFDDDSTATVNDAIYGVIERPQDGWGCNTYNKITDEPSVYSQFYVDINPGGRGLTMGGNKRGCEEVWANRPIPYKVVFDREDEVLYIKVANLDDWEVDISNPTPSDYYWCQEVVDAQTMGLVKMNVNDLNDFSRIMYDEPKDIFDLIMSKDDAFRFAIGEDDMGTIYRLRDGELVANVGEHVYPVENWRDTMNGMKLTQQPSTDENRLWKLVPYGSGGVEDTQIKLIGYNLEGGGSRELVMVAPFVFNNLEWFNVHMHDGKIIITTADGSTDPWLIGIWMVK